MNNVSAGSLAIAFARARAYNPDLFHQGTDRLLSPIRRFGDRIFELLVVSAPGDVGSRCLLIGISVLIVVNALAQGIGWWGRLPGIDLWLVWFQRISLALFAVEYGARVWVGHEDGSRHASRLRRLAHPLMLVDLLVLAVALVTPWALDLRFLRLLRVPDLLARISRSLAGAELAPDQVAITDVITDRQQALADIRRDLATASQQDIGQMRDQLSTVTTNIRRVQQRWLLLARRDLDKARQESPTTRQTIMQLLDELEQDLEAGQRIKVARDHIRGAWEQTGDICDPMPEVAIDVRDLDWKGRRSYRPVPVRQVGQRHFRPLKGKHESVQRAFEDVYSTGLSEGLAGVRSAMGFPFDMVERRASDASPTQLQGALSRAVNRCRDLDGPSRSAWDQVQWQLELAHVNGVDLTVGDVSRYGRIDFYIAHATRRLWAHLLHAFDIGRDLSVGMVPKVLERGLEEYQQAMAVVRPLLEWVGLRRPPKLRTMEQAEQARLESVLQGGLPSDYLTHFNMEPLLDETLLVGFERELADIDRAVERWESSQTSSFVVHGPRGGGKTSLLNVAEARLFEEDAQVSRAVVVDKVTTSTELARYLAGLLGLPVSEDVSDVAAALLSGPRRAVILEGCHNLYFRRIGGLDAMRQLLWLVARTNHHVLWGLCLDENARDYLARWLPFDRLFHFDIGIGGHTGAELRNLIMQRHNLSGYRLRFDVGPSVQRALRRRVGRYQRVEEPAVQAALGQIYFEELAETCIDNTTVAQFYWLRSLTPAGGDMYAVTPHDEIDLEQVRDLSMDAAFLLSAILQHDNLNPSELATIVDRTLIDVRLELEILWNSNILGGSLEEERFRINAVALKSVRAMLAGRNLIH